MRGAASIDLGIAARGVVDTDEVVCHLKAAFR
jgi:hypothetical protein